MDPDIAIFVYIIIVAIIYYVAFTIAKITSISSFVLALIFGLLALSILCPLSAFDQTQDYQGNLIAYAIISFLTVIIVVLYVIAATLQDRQHTSH